MVIPDLITLHHISATAFPSNRTDAQNNFSRTENVSRKKIFAAPKCFAPFHARWVEIHVPDAVLSAI